MLKKNNTKQVESMVPYDFFSQLFCVSIEELIDIAFSGPNRIVPTVAFLQCLSQALLLCAQSANSRWSSVCGEATVSVCR